uniref:Chemokine interleukin-8-like domain-containing protein n=1 Tax=Xiphophorus maculatus TaxID=8083 RepID=A0A3B5Q853_XIPMA
MKTLCLSVGMILIIASVAVQYNTGPITCCDQFSNMRVPGKMIVDITRTHSSCLKRGYIVETVKGRLFCFRQSTTWVEEAYNRMFNSEGSGLYSHFTKC